MPQLRRWYISDSSNFISPNCHILHRLPQPPLAMFAHLLHYIKGGKKWTPKNCNVCKPDCSFWQLVWSGRDNQNWITIIIIFAPFCPFCPFQDRDRKSGKDIQSNFPKLLFVKIHSKQDDRMSVWLNLYGFSPLCVSKLERHSIQLCKTTFCQDPCEMTVWG